MLITIGNFKGGSGKTITAFHIAAYMQTAGRTILGDVYSLWAIGRRDDETDFSDLIEALLDAWLATP